MAFSQKLPRAGRITSNDLSPLTPEAVEKGLGAVSNPAGRFEKYNTERVDDGWYQDEDELAPDLNIAWHREKARSIITHNQSPDISFDRSINPYRGCEHGCIYCFARPSHAYLGHSAGIDFERQLYFKTNAVERLRQELAARAYTPAPLALGVNTDAYQPEERRLRLTRAILEVLAEHNHPVTIVTKSGLIRRDIDLLAPMAEKNIARVAISLTTLDKDLARKMEPRAASPQLRLKTIKALSDAGIPVTVMTAPIIPCINEAEIEDLLQAAYDHGARNAGYVLLRLPYELKDIFHEWLVAHFPDRALRVINTMRAMRGGLDYDADWSKRQRGEGVQARMIGSRFHKSAARIGLNSKRQHLRTDLFRKPPQNKDQLSFDL
ncbi:PA0069 family radical SAM protein [Ponticaulis profundi]|uniref:PA0069 family radical SAM protein n=1 Tax=Ponticaulis profundi TaxID=2665222 RepID=A0ABW1S6T3_9PROT